MTSTVDDALDRLRRQDAAVPEPGTSLTIAEMAERTGVSAHTLRYYERSGLLDVGRDRPDIAPTPPPTSPASCSSTACA